MAERETIKELIQLVCFSSGFWGELGIEQKVLRQAGGGGCPGRRHPSRLTVTPAAFAFVPHPGLFEPYSGLIPTLWSCTILVFTKDGGPTALDDSTEPTCVQIGLLVFRT